MHRSDIHTISASAPPSYAEATGQPASTYIPTDNQASYNQERTQMHGYPYQYPNNFYSQHIQPSSQPPYPIYDYTSTQQIQSATTATIPSNTVVIRSRAADRTIFTCCRLLWAIGVFVIAIIVSALIINTVY